ncbi:hypothetical protein CPB84DRAFT_1726177 [Gymnopilus junonius]|uniref:RING-type domain-containing protein n=1 Tax=Gymnopilus junonius TaxID=109634 RepID=A0A9P5TRX1_GYMJU|nr:hypothetical protein CPB84DRAFT_1726177 [Gymnopilus junonius]
MATQDTLPQDGVLRRIRSDGDIPSRPERAHIRTNRGISESTGDHQAGHSRQISSNLASPIVARHQSPSSIPSTPTNLSTWSPPLSSARSIPPIQPPQGTPPSADQQSTTRAQAIPHNIPLYVRLMMYFGIGRNASYARKSLVSLIWNISWGFLQVVVIMTMLILTGTHFRSASDPGLSEWTACDRPLGVWASLWVVRVILASSLAYWDFLRERVLHPLRSDAEADTNSNVQQPMMTANHAENAPAATSGNQTVNSSISAPIRPTDSNISYSRTYSRLTLVSSLMTLSWFLTAHILEYTSISTCRHTSPHLWWLVFGILCIMYLMVLEVVLVGLIVLVIAPIIFIFWNILLICIGRHPIQNPHMIKPEIGKLSKSVVERIPLVMYIPSPPESERVTSAEVPHSYPPKIPQAASKPSQRRFKLLRNLSSFRSKKSDEGIDKTNEKNDELLSNLQGPISWEDNWEQSEYPFVALEGNRAACAICLMDFEEPKKKNAAAKQESGDQPTEGKNSTNSSTLPPTIAEVQRGDDLKLEDAGEGAQPLRLLQCGHVFHKTCLDPWLTDVSGRCPVCQRPVEIPKPKKSRRTP